MEIVLFTRLIAVTEWKTKNTAKLFTGKFCYCSVHGGETENKVLYGEKSGPKSYFNYPTARKKQVGIQ